MGSGVMLRPDLWGMLQCYEVSSGVSNEVITMDLKPAMEFNLGSQLKLITVLTSFVSILTSFVPPTVSPSSPRPSPLLVN